MTVARYATFSSVYGSNLTVPTSNVSDSSAVAANARVLRICNTGAILAYVKTGLAVINASVADMPIPSGECVVIHKPQGHTTIAYINQGLIGSTLQIQTGQGE